MRIDVNNDSAAHRTSSQLRYDGEGRLASERVRVLESIDGPGRYVVSYDYDTDAAGIVTMSPTCDREPCYQEETRFQYDAEGAVVEVREGEHTTYCHYSAEPTEGGRVTSITSDRSECTQHFSYDESGHLLGIVHTCEGNLERVEVARKTAANRMELVEFRGGSESGPVTFFIGNCGSILFHPCQANSAAPAP